jgi:hypothetical protein
MGVLSFLFYYSRIGGALSVGGCVWAGHFVFVFVHFTFFVVLYFVFQFLFYLPMRRVEVGGCECKKESWKEVKGSTGDSVSMIFRKK